MQIYLPIAEMPVDIFYILLLGFFSGVISGLLGIGGGVIVTPMLMFIGIPHSVAIATTTNQIIGSSFSGLISNYKEKNVDIIMGIILVLGGILGAISGVVLFNFLKQIGLIELVTSITYLLILGFIGISMIIEQIYFLYNKKSSNSKSKKETDNHLFQKMPLKMNFIRSNIKISVFLPFIIGILGGILVSMLGIGGGFVMIPAMIYMLKIPTRIAVGTSLLQIFIVSIIVTLINAGVNKTVDIILASFLLITSVIGAQIGIRISKNISPIRIKLLLALIIIFIASELAISLLIEPDNLYEVFKN